MTCTAGARQIDSTVLKRPRPNVGSDRFMRCPKTRVAPAGVCEWRCALKGGLPGRSPAMTCTAGARRVDVIVPRTPRCSDIFCEGLCALKE